jgi:hypothetical protein
LAVGNLADAKQNKLGLMKPPTPVDLAASSDEAVFQCLREELEHRMPMSHESPEFLVELRKLPRGLRAMAATYELDVSLTMDDLGWHFGNWHSAELAEETSCGLEELEATELATLFRQAFGHAKVFWTQLGSNNWTDWYHGSEFERVIEPLTEEAWAILKPRWNGIFSYWVAYARRHPDRIGWT